MHVEYVIERKNDYFYEINELVEPLILNSLQDPTYPNGERVYDIYEIKNKYDKHGSEAGLYVDYEKCVVDVICNIYFNGKSDITHDNTPDITPDITFMKLCIAKMKGMIFK